MQAANELLFVGALIFVAAVVISSWAFRVGAPLLLVFLVVGMLAGVDGPGGIRFTTTAPPTSSATSPWR